jgi:hypothetical protein
MESIGSVTLQPIIVRDRQSPWTRTVAVIRVPRFTAFRTPRGESTVAEDPVTAFTAEAELRASTRRWRR